MVSLPFDGTRGGHTQHLNIGIPLLLTNSTYLRAFTNLKRGSQMSKKNGRGRTYLGALAGSLSRTAVFDDLENRISKDTPVLDSRGVLNEGAVDEFLNQ